LHKKRAILIYETSNQERTKLDKQQVNEKPVGVAGSDDLVDLGKRGSVVKLAYASPLLAGLLFSKNSAAISPPPPPPTP
jgi:hypothetical protein